MPKNSQTKTNTLRTVLLQDEAVKCNKNTIEAVFRALMEPVVQCKENSLVLVRLANAESLENVLKRINFVNPNIFSFSSGLDFLKNIEESTQWGDCEFLIVLSPRYSAVLLWDYSLSPEIGYEEGTSSVYFMVNSRRVFDIAQDIADASSFELSKLLNQFTPERRANEILNTAFAGVVNCLNSTTQEYTMTQAEKDTIISDQDLYKQYEYVFNQIAPVSHEIKNHLSVIDLYSKILEKKLELLPAGESNQEILSSCKNAITSINKSVFSVSFILNSLKQAEIKLAERKLNDLILTAMQLTAPKTENNGIEIVFEPQDNVNVLVDEIKFQNVLLNLIYNSIDAITENGKIEIRTKTENERAKIVIKDNGKGICESVKEKLFTQGETTKQCGQGLGLNICKQNMVEQGGDIRLISTNGEGTEFEVTIPLAK